MSGPGDKGDFSLFDQEERVLARTEEMLHNLEDVGAGVRMLAEAYRRSYREQQRLVRLSDRMQLELHQANQRLEEQAGELSKLNKTLNGEIERRAALEQELRRLAMTDSLTGVSSRGHLLEVIGRELKRVSRSEAPLSFLLMDLDRFKLVNDTHGHAAGDRALVCFADLCRATLRDTDAFGRLGGEEFAAMLPDTDLAGAREVAERIRERLAEEGVEWRGERLHLTVSIGVTAAGAGDDAPARALARADRALYRAKNAGRNRVEVEEP